MKDTKEVAESITKVVDRLDVLINNAGAYFPKYRETSEGFRIHPGIKLLISISAYPSSNKADGTDRL